MRWFTIMLEPHFLERRGLYSVQQLCKNFKELGNDDQRSRSGRKLIVNASWNRMAIEKRVQRNPRVSMKQIVHDMGISDRSVRRIAKTELGLKPYKLRKFQLLTEKKTRTARVMPKTFETALGEIPFH
ncbi:uncharacterized protein TNCV_2985171 [Trichonephila clavipes]|nr:uncharacterized protein TNCV_2985171 [Trichonephila clavipes]